MKGSDPRERYNTNGQDGQRRSFRPSSYPSLPFSLLWLKGGSWKEDRAGNICRDIVIVVVECQLEESRGLLIKRGNLGVGGFSGWFFERCGTMEVFDDRYPGQGENL